MKCFILAAIVAMAYASPIHIITATSRPPPTIECPSELCSIEGKNKENGNYRHPANPSFFYTCEEGKAVSCKPCDFDNFLVFNENCNQCRYPADIYSTECDFYTGSTVANTVCSADDEVYAQWFCRNLDNIFGDGWKDAHGDFAYVQYGSLSYKKEGQKDSFYISCVGGMYGWCRFCPSNLVWYESRDKDGNVELDSGICDYRQQSGDGK